MSATFSPWKRIVVPTLHQQQGALPPDGNLIVVRTPGNYGVDVGYLNAETMTFEYIDGSAAPISDYDGAWWMPIPPLPKGETP